jgi:hypothetical protein
VSLNNVIASKDSRSRYRSGLGTPLTRSISKTELLFEIATTVGLPATAILAGWLPRG